MSEIIYSQGKDMRYIDYNNIRFQQIQIFLCAAECGNFTAAAERMHVTQPMVSKTIQMLEQETGIILFRKMHGKPCLTPAGREIQTYWSNILDLFEMSISNAQTIQEVKDLPIRFGLGMSSQRKDVKQLLYHIRERYPDMNMHLECGNMTGLLHRIYQGDLDLTVCSGHLLPNIKSLRLSYKTVSYTSLAIYIPKSNPLSEKEKIDFSELRNEEFITFSPESDPLYWNLLNEIAMKAGFRPKVACYVKDELSFQINLEWGKGIVLADSNTLELDHVRKVILEDTQCNLLLVWKEENNNPGARKVIDLL